MSDQLPLALRWPEHQRFESFVVGGNLAAVEQLRAISAGKDAAWAYLVGAEGSGSTHLLVATCAAASAGGRVAQYLSLASVRAPRADALRGFGGSALLALDDVDAIAGDAAAEHALFDLYNRCRAEGTHVLFAASAAPAKVGFCLPDLVSRLGACTQFALKPLDEDARRELVRARAASRGIQLDDGALDWLFARGRRDLGSMLAVLDRIDRASLAAKRRVTLPFLRALLGEAAGES